MSPEKLIELLEIAKNAAVEAGMVILDVYNGKDFGIETKSDDSPITIADKKSNELICKSIEGFEIPILSEEGIHLPYDVRRKWEYFWMIDPLDGTKEFIKRNGEFTVNIALIHRDRPILGVIYVPVQRALYFGLMGKEAKKQTEDSTTILSCSSQKNPVVRVVCSRSQLNEDTRNYIEKLGNTQLTPTGSSLKFMKIAEGSADIYPRFGTTMEWDTAAAQAILETAGGSIIQSEKDMPLLYNKKNLQNPHFIARPTKI